MLYGGADEGPDGGDDRRGEDETTCCTEAGGSLDTRCIPVSLQ